MKTQPAFTAAGLLLWAAQTACADAPTVYLITPGGNQQVRFQAKTRIETYGGTTDRVSGEVKASRERPLDNPTARIVVDTASLSTGDSGRDSNMRRKFLEVDKYPTATFVMTSVQSPKTVGPLAVGVSVSGTARGTFTLHGVTRTITPQVTVTRETNTTGRDLLHIVARFVVRLEDYHIAAPRIVFVVVQQEHPVTVDIRAVAPL